MGNFGEFCANSLFFFALRGLFPVSGRVCGAALGFCLGFCGVNFPGLAPLIAAGYFMDGHNDWFLGFNCTNIPVPAGNIAPKTRFFTQNCKN